METNHKWQNYWLWLSERGQVHPHFSSECLSETAIAHYSTHNDRQDLEMSSNNRTSSPTKAPSLANIKLSGFGAVTPSILFVGDAPMQSEESDMMIKMIKAIGLNPFTDTYVCDFFDGVRGWPSENQFRSAQIDLNAYIDHTPTLRCIVSLGVGGAKILYGIEKDLKPLKSQWLKTDNKIALDCIATFHPRDMIKRPESKRPAWIDLQSIKAKLHLEMDNTQ